MEIFYGKEYVKILLLSSIFLYALAAMLSLVLIKKHKASNIVSNLICAIAAAAGFAGSLMQVANGKESIAIGKFESAVPFISIGLRADHLSSFFILILSVLVFCVSVYSIGYASHYYGKRNVGFFNFLYAAFVLSMFLVFTAENAVFFFIVWEAMAVFSYFLVVFESEIEENRKAGTIYIVMTHLGTALIMIAFMIMYYYTHSFNIFENTALIPEVPENVMFLLFLIGFGTKAGIIPVHIWLPYAHPAAPSNVSALMSGIMIKTAVYGMLRFVFAYLGAEHTLWGLIILILGIISAFLGIAYAYVEKNIKRLLACSSIENIGIIYISLGVAMIAFSQGNSAAGTIAITAAMLHTLNHSIFKGSLFLGAGSVLFSTHTKNMEALGGLIKKMPVTALFILVGCLSASALVPFNGFVSEWLVFQSLFFNISHGEAGINIVSILAAAVLALSGALAAGSYVKFFGISFLGLPRTERAMTASEVPNVMNAGVGILAALCLFIGIFPMLFLKMVGMVVLTLTGRTAAEMLHGGLFAAYCRLDAAGNTVSPAIIMSIMLIAIFAVLAGLKITGKNYSVRKYATWDCGFERLTPRMQYTATGFSGPLKIVFKSIYCFSNRLEVSGNRYHPKEMEYSSSLEYVFEKYLYDPIVSFANRFSRKAKFTIQTGSIHSYLIYIFIAVLAMMLYNRLA